MLFSLCKWDEMQAKRMAAFPGNDCAVCRLIMHRMTFLHEVEKDLGPLFPKNLQKDADKCWSPPSYQQR